MSKQKIKIFNKHNARMFITKFLLLVLAILSVVMITYILVSAFTDGNNMLDIYYSLADKTRDSKASFTKKRNYITIAKDGSVTVDNSEDIDYENEDGQTAEEATGDGGSVTAEDQKLIDAFMAQGYTKNKSQGLAACYKACIDAGMSTKESLGLLMCASCEGAPGLLQFGYKIGDHSSTAKHPYYIESKEVAQYGHDNYVKSRGAGTAQWTNGRFTLYMQMLIDSCSSYSDVDLMNADYKMYLSELTGQYKHVVSDVKQHNSNYESILVYEFFQYEFGSGHYSKGSDRDTIAHYSGDARKYLEQRWSNKDKIIAALNSCGAQL